MKLSKRLATIAALVPPGGRLADIGTDHAYLPVYLVTEGIVPSAVAGEVNEGPFRAAGEALARVGLADRISLRFGDGLAVLAPGEADTAVIAGMGGQTIVDILAARPEGLHVEIRPPLGRRRRLLIPWSEFGPGQEVLLYWLSAVRFPIGHPPLAQLTVMGNAYEQMQPYLPPASRVVGR